MKSALAWLLPLAGTKRKYPNFSSELNNGGGAGQGIVSFLFTICCKRSFVNKIFSVLYLYQYKGRWIDHISISMQ